MRPLVRSCTWSPDRNSMRPRKSATRCQVTTHNAVQLPYAIRVGYEITIPSCFIGIPWFSGPLCAPPFWGRGSGGTPPWETYPLAESLPPVPGWRAATRPTTVGGNSAGLCMRPVGACIPPPTSSWPHPSLTVPSHPSTTIMVWHHRYNPPSNFSPWLWWNPDRRKISVPT